MKPPGGFSTTKVDYLHKPRPNTAVWNLPDVDPRTLPAVLPTVKVPSPLMSGEQISFMGVIVAYDAETTGSLVRFDIRRRLADGKYEDKVQQYQGAAMKKEDGQLHYSIPGRVSTVPGVYQYTFFTIGPTFVQQGKTADLNAMDAYLTGTFEVVPAGRSK